MGKIFKALEKSEQANDTNPVYDFHAESGETKGGPSKVSTDRPFAEKKSKINNHAAFSGSTPLNANAGRNLVSVKKPHSIEAEQFRLLKNNLLFPETGYPPRTIMVTSTCQGEGKSFVAANLAVAIASSIDEYVLLVDCDLRHPSVHSMFDLENNEGLTTYLTQGVPLSRVLVKTFLPKLTVLPGGTPPANPSELVSSEQMRRLIREAKTRYDDRYVILDAPPPYITSETNALAKHVDGILLVVKHGLTRKDRIKDIIDIYGKEKIIGVVKNFAKGRFGLGYGYKYKYGYSMKG
ncbi:MAG: polysaccharide biosynthesis tyrosine autokinase [Desulfobacteraceae bacterium]